MKTQTLTTFRLDKQDQKRLREIAKHYSADAGVVMRMLIKVEHDQLPMGDLTSAQMRRLGWLGTDGLMTEKFRIAMEAKRRRPRVAHKDLLRYEINRAATPPRKTIAVLVRNFG